MNSPQMYHAAITLLMDIIDNDANDKLALQPALKYLKGKRLQALDEALKTKQNSNLSKPQHEK